MNAVDEIRRRGAQSAFPRFLAVGLVGLVVDLGLLTLLEHAGLVMAAARAVSLPIAITATWLLNRRFVFKDGGRKAHDEAARYFAVAFACQGFNYVVGLTCAALFPALPHVVDGFIGSISATLLSYVGQKLITFSKPQAG